MPRRWLPWKKRLIAGDRPGKAALTAEENQGCGIHQTPPCKRPAFPGDISGILRTAGRARQDQTVRKGRIPYIPAEKPVEDEATAE
jgi:hypothetical protein